VLNACLEKTAGCQAKGDCPMRILAATLLVWIALCAKLLAEVAVGSAKQDVLTEWGKPMSQFTTTGGTLTFIYADGREVDFENGKVVNISKTLTAKNKGATTSRTSRVDSPPVTPAKQPAAEVKKTVQEQPKAVPARTNAPAATSAVAPAKTSAPVVPPVSSAPAAPPPPHKTKTDSQAAMPRPAPASPQPPPPEMMEPGLAQPVQSPPVEPAGDVPGLLLQLGSSNKKAQSAAAYALLAMGKPVSPTLIQYYRDPKTPPEGQKAAVHIVAQQLGKDLADPFIVDLTNQNCSAILEILRYLVPMKDPRAVEPMMRLMETADYAPEIRKLTAKGLGEIGDPKALNMLILQFNLDKDEMVQIELANAMDKITGQTNYFNAAARYEWINKNHPEWFKAGPETYKVRPGLYNKVGFMYGGGFAFALIVAIWRWKRR
jgi:hypothetical protein